MKMQFNPYVPHRRDAIKTLPDGIGVRTSSSRSGCPPVRAAHPADWFHRIEDTLSEDEFSLRACNIHDDQSLFHAWQNNPRVAEFWNEQGDMDSHRAYLTRLSNDRHAFGAMGYLNGVPSAYVEIYWTLEDRLGHHYDATFYDRGFHFLIGEEVHAGKGLGAAWLRVISHALFMAEPATQRLYCGPDARNTRFIKAASRAGFQKIKEFDFPHKRAALMENTRERFFREIWCC